MPVENLGVHPIKCVELDCFHINVSLLPSSSFVLMMVDVGISPFFSYSFYNPDANYVSF